MARPRIFISSTYYDLKHIRASIAGFVETLGYDPILFENGDIAFTPDQALDSSCYRDARDADIFVLVVESRYGSATSEASVPDIEFYTEYNSITQQEFNNAYAASVPIYVLVDRSVHAEYETFKVNRGNKTVKYFHAKSVGVFTLLDLIYSKPLNNNVFKFDRASEIENWLRLQWAGLFRDLLINKSNSQQLSDLNDQITHLSNANNQLKNYLEALIIKTNPEESADIISKENFKKDISNIAAVFKKSDGAGLYNQFVKQFKNRYEDVVDMIISPKSKDEAIDRYNSLCPSDFRLRLENDSGMQLSYDQLRVDAGIPELFFIKLSGEESLMTTSERSKNKSDIVQRIIGRDQPKKYN